MDAAFHLIIPIIMLKFFKVNIPDKYLFALLPLALILDLDSIIGMKKLFHSIFVIALILAIVFILAIKKKEKIQILGLSAFYLFSHVLLDLGSVYTPFYPLSQEAFLIELNVAMSGFLPVLNFGIHKLAETTGSLGLSIGNPLSEVGFGLLFIIAFAVLIGKLIARRRH